MSAALKCLVWDLDNTLWDGVLLEASSVALRQAAARAVVTLDERGIIQSIASRNHHPDAQRQLEAFGLWEYFLYPQICWGSKSDSIMAIAKSLNIALDAIGIVDDDPFERAEIGHGLPR